MPKSTIDDLMTRYKQYLKRTWARLTDDDCDDILSEVTVRIYRRYRPSVNLATLDQRVVWRFVANVQCEHYRAHRHYENESSLGVSDQQRLEAAIGAPGVEEVVVDRLSIEELLAQMPLRWRKVIEMKADGFTTRAIGEEMGISQCAVQAMVQRVRATAAELALAA